MQRPLVTACGAPRRRARRRSAWMRSATRCLSQPSSASSSFKRTSRWLQCSLVSLVSRAAETSFCAPPGNLLAHLTILRATRGACGTDSGLRQISPPRAASPPSSAPLPRTDLTGPPRARRSQVRSCARGPRGHPLRSSPTTSVITCARWGSWRPMTRSTRYSRVGRA